MIFRILANIVVLIHFAFVLFVVLGGLLVVRWRGVAWIHVPAAIWGALIELTGWICPLTPLENWLRQQGGGNPYDGGFIETHLLRLLYPEGLTRGVEWTLGVIVIIVNIFVYWLAFRRS